MEDKVKCEIEDLETGCTYIRSGETLERCVADFQAFFFTPHKHKILWQRSVEHGNTSKEKA